MVVWPKPCESRSSPGFIPKNPAAHAAGFFLCASARHDAGRVGSQTTADNGDGCFDARTLIEAMPQLHRALPGDCNAITGRGPCNGSRSGCDPTNAGPCRRDGIGSCIAPCWRGGIRVCAWLPSVGSVPKRLPITAMGALTPGPVSKRCPSYTEPSPLIAMPSANVDRATAVDRDATPRVRKTGTAPLRAPFLFASPQGTAQPAALRVCAACRTAADDLTDGGIPLPRRSGLRPGLRAGGPLHWPPRPAPRSAGWRRPSG